MIPDPSPFYLGKEALLILETVNRNGTFIIERYTPVRGFVCCFREIRKFHKQRYDLSYITILKVIMLKSAKGCHFD